MPTFLSCQVKRDKMMYACIDTPKSPTSLDFSEVPNVTLSYYYWSGYNSRPLKPRNYILSNEALRCKSTPGRKRVMKKNATKKNAGNKFLLCCRPVDMDGVLESRVVIKRSNHRSLLCSSVEDTAIVKTAGIKSVSSDGGLSKKSLNLVLHRPPKRKLPRVIHAVVFEIILRKGVYKRKVEGLDSNGTSKCKPENENSSNDYETERPKQSIVPDTDIAEVKPILKSPNSLPFSEQNNPSRSISNNEASVQYRSQDAVMSKKMTDHIDCYILYVLLAVATFTVIWGKLGGILCTSIWLYYHSYQQTSYSRLLRRSSRQGRSRILFQQEDHTGERKLLHRRTTTL